MNYSSNQKQRVLIKKLLPDLAELANSVDRASLLERIVEHAKELMAADHVHVRTIDWVNDELVLEKSTGLKTISDSSSFKRIRTNEAFGGMVFGSKEISISNDVTQNVRFKRYLKKLRDNDAPEKLINQLLNFGPALAAPLLMDNKPIGVLTAVRVRKGSRSTLPKSFDESDGVILQLFANQAAIALRNNWLFEAATWNPEFDALSVADLCQEVVLEAKKLTGADDGKVRFVDWEEKRLVPGAVDYSLKTFQKYPELFVRNLGVSVVGKLAEQYANQVQDDELQKGVYGNLLNNTYFVEFLNSIRKEEELLSKQIDYLKDWKIKLSEYESGTIEDFFNEISSQISLIENGYETLRESLEERLKALKTELNKRDLGGVRVSLNDQLNTIEGLRKGQSDYRKHLQLLRSEVVVPIVMGNKLLGMINVHSKKEEWFNGSDEATLKALAGRVALGVMNYQHKILSEVQKIEQEMTVGNKFSEEIAEFVADGIKRVAFLTGNVDVFPFLYTCIPVAPDVLILRQEQFGRNFEPHPRKKAGKEERQLLNVPIRNNGLGWEVVNKLVDYKDPAMAVRLNVGDPISGGSPTARRKKVLSTACLPLVFDGKIWGLLYIHMKRKHYFTELEKESMLLFAAQTAIVIKNVKEYPPEQTYDEIFGVALLNEYCHSEK